MKYIRNYSPHVFFLSVMLIVTGSETDPKPDPENVIADSIDITWELTENDIGGQNRSRAAFTFRNNGADTLGNSGWSIYFNYRHRYIEGTASKIADFRFINGNFYQLSPTEHFELAPGETVTIHYESRGRMIKNDRAPAGLYFVFTDPEGNEEIALIRNYSVTPIEPAQVGQNVPTPESRFNENKRLFDLNPEDLIPILPTPREIQYGEGEVILNAEFQIHYEAGLKKKAGYLAAMLEKILGFQPVITENGEEGPGIISLKKGSRETIENPSEEAYYLEISKETGINIHGMNSAGVFYGVQSLLALFPPEVFKKPRESVRLQTLSIQDAPRFSYRGMHMDVSRNFNDKEAVFKLLDIMASYKLNKFHFHLTDDEGWRLQINGLPELTDVGAFRGHTLDDSEHLHPSYGSGPYSDPDSSYGSGYYNRKDYMDILRYANDRHIEIIPEIDVPGHARAANRAMDARYDRFMAEGNEKKAREYLLVDPEDQSEYRSIQGYDDNVVNVCMESTYRFYATVLDDILAMHREAEVPLNTVHMGGDEVPSGVWERSPICQEFIEENLQITDHRDLMEYFMARLIRIHKDRDINIAGWQEIGIVLDENGEHQANSALTEEDVIIYSWDNFRTVNLDIGYKMANTGYPVVLSNATNLYLELAYENHPSEPGDYFAGFVNTQNVYEFMPMNFLATLEPPSDRNLISLDPDAAKNILGMQGHLWSEPIKGPDSLEYFYSPEILALAERAWASQPDWEIMAEQAQREITFQKDWNIFANTLGQRELDRLDVLNGGYNYRIPPPGARVDDNNMLHANVAFPGLQIRYTTDGSDPIPQSEIYRYPLLIEGKVNLRTFNSKGRASRISKIQIEGFK